MNSTCSSSAAAWPASAPRCTSRPRTRGRHHQARAGRRRQPVGAGRHRGGARRGRQRPVARRRHAGRRRRPLRPGRDALRRRACARRRSTGCSNSACRSRSEHGALHLTREGGHSERRIVHAADATGTAIQRHADRARARAHPNITLLEQHMAIDLITSRHLQARPSRTRLPRPLRARHRDRPASRPSRATARRARHRRRRQGLPLHDQPRHRDRRRHRDGLARRLPRREHGVHPVPPDLPVPPAGAKSFLITEAVRGEGGVCCKLPRRHALHAGARRARRTRAARHRGARDRLRDEEARPRLRAASTSRTRPRPS